MTLVFSCHVLSTGSRFPSSPDASEGRIGGDVAYAAAKTPAIDALILAQHQGAAGIALAALAIVDTAAWSAPLKTSA